MMKKRPTRNSMQIVKMREDKELLPSTINAKAPLERLIDELTNIAFSNIGNYIEWDGFRAVARPSSQLNPAQLAAIRGIRFVDGEPTLQLYDKNKAIELLCKLLSVTPKTSTDRQQGYIPGGKISPEEAELTNDLIQSKIDELLGK